ncbi:MAG TPA: tRNA pseudouridine(13) synthase TruD [Kofleriaceae bacterium]|jgi:tRNA pseudouridine13 synthase
MLPYLTADLAGIGGVLRAHDQDFFVDEEPAYAPTGQGEHVFARIEKRGLATPQAIDRIARALGCASRDVGVAGMKDRHAVTRQWISLPPPIGPETVSALVLDDIAILEVARHGHKLRTGHLRGNRFVLRVRDAGPDAAPRARAILERLARPPGAPNWYGEQRFGRDGDNAARGRAIALGTEKPPRDRRLARLLVSALQSELFNSWLVARLADGLYARVVAGDILHKTTGGQFTCEDPAVDEARLVAGELVPTGPMFGSRMRRPPDGSPAAAREDAILAAAELSLAAFEPVRALAEGTRRDAAFAVTEPSVASLPEGVLEVAFALPAGAYATAVMREIMKLGPQASDLGPRAQDPESEA